MCLNQVCQRLIRVQRQGAADILMGLLVISRFITELSADRMQKGPFRRLFDRGFYALEGCTGLARQSIQFNQSPL